jgi:hypothetical protein
LVAVIQSSIAACHPSAIPGLRVNGGCRPENERGDARDEDARGFHDGV